MLINGIKNIYINQSNNDQQHLIQCCCNISQHMLIDICIWLSVININNLHLIFNQNNVLYLNIIIVKKSLNIPRIKFLIPIKNIQISIYKALFNG